MKHGGAYRKSTRVMALVMALLMMLSTGGFALRDGTEPKPEPMAEVPAETISEPAGPEEVTAPSEQVTAPSEDTPVPSEDTPVPSEDTPVPSEDTPVPSEDIPAPSEEVPAPSEDTPAPSGDPADGENASVGGVAPAPAETDPAETTPEPTADPNAGIMTVDLPVPAADGPNIQFTVTADGGNPAKETWDRNTTLKYTLTVRNAGGALISNTSNAAFKLTFENSTGTLLKPAFVEDTITQIGGENVPASLDGTNNFYIGARGATNTNKSGDTVMGAGSAVSVQIQVKLNEAAASEKAFTFTLKISSLDGSSFQGITFPASSQTFDQNGTGGTGGGTPSETYTLVYHLNPPDGTAEPVGEGEGIHTEVQTDTGTFTLKSVGRTNEGDANNTMFSENADHSDQLIQGEYKDGTDYYFAGWNRTPVTPAGFSTYNEIDYPITEIGQSGQNYRGFQSGTEITVEDRTDLYAVWVYAANSGLFGYVLTDPGATFDLTQYTEKPTSRWKTSEGQILGDNGWTSEGHAKKFVVYDAGYVKDDGKTFTVTKDKPRVSDKNFVGWYEKDKEGDRTGHIVVGGDTIYYGGENSVYSLDAIWGTVSGGTSVTQTYDGQPHAIGIGNLQTNYSGGGITKLESLKNPATSVSYTYAVTKDGEPVTGTTDSSGVPQFTAPGVYEYEITSTLKDPGHMRNEAVKTNGITVGTTNATLTIYPVLDLTVKKTVMGDSAPAGNYTFAITTGAENSAYVVINEPTLTVEAKNSKTTRLAFTNPGTYEITVAETNGGVPGMTYAGAQSFSVTVDNNYQITSITGANNPQYPNGNGTAELTFTNEYKTGSLTVTKQMAGTFAGLDNDTSFNFNVKLTNGAGEPVTGTFGDKVFTADGLAFTVKSGKPVNITGLPVGTTAIVTETPGDIYETPTFNPTEANTTGVTITETGAAVTITNTRKTGSLTVTKTVTNPFTGLTDGPFTIQVQADAGLNGEFTATGLEGGADKVTFTGGRASFSISSNGSVTISDLPAGMHFTVTETDAANYTVAYSGGAGVSSNEVTIPADDTAAVTVTNTRRTGSLTVTKKVEGYASNRSFHFSVELQDNGVLVSGSFGGVTFTDGVYTFALTPGSDSSASRTITGLPAGVAYTVTETEADQNGYTTTSTGTTGTTGVIDAVNPAAATFTNTRATGSLTVTKTVTGTDADKEASFSFTVRLTDPDGRPVAGSFGGVVFDAQGVSETQTVKHDTSVTFTDLPAGATAVVTETDADSKYTVSYDPASAVIPANGTASIGITNARKTGQLTVVKLMLNGTAADEIRDFQFTLALTDGGRPVTGSYNYSVGGGPEQSADFTSGSHTFTIRPGEGNAVVITGLPLGAHGEVQEIGNADYDTTYVTGSMSTNMVGTSGSVSGTIGTDSRVVIRNVRKTGSLVITKTVAGADNVTSEAARTFTFTVKLTEADGTTPISGTFGDVVFGPDGVSSALTVGAGQFVTISDLPAGARYTVTEQAAYPFYSLTATTAGTGTIPADGSVTAAFTNTFQRGSVKLVKQVAAGGNTQGTFTFRATLLSGSGGASSRISGDFPIAAGAGTLGGVTNGMLHFENGVSDMFTLTVAPTASGALTAGADVTISGLPAGLQFVAEELQGASAEYDVTYSNNHAAIPANGTLTVTVTNTYKGGDLKISKQVVDAPVGTAPKFTYTVTLTNADKTPFTGHRGVTSSIGGVTTTQSVYIQNGVYTFSEGLGDGDSFTILSLPEGLTYEVKEDQQPGYVRSFGSGSAYSTGAIGKGTTEVKYVNTYRPDTLHVVKVFDVPAGYDTSGLSASFTITLDGHRGCNDKHGDVQFENGVGSFTLTPDHNSVDLTQLPDGQFTITETSVNNGFVTSIEVAGDSGTAQVTDKTVTDTFTTATNAKTVTFTNRLARGGLTVTKTLLQPAVGEDLNTGRTFGFTVTLSDDAINGKYGDMTFEDGVASFELAGVTTTDTPNTLSAADLPAGLTYTVTETGADDYATTVTNSAAGGSVNNEARTATGTIADGGTAAVAFTNTFKTGSLTVTKRVDGNDGETGQFWITLEKINDPRFGGTYGDFTFYGGSASAPISKNGTLSAVGLPAGAAFRVTELNAGSGYTTAYETASGTVGDPPTVTIPYAASAAASPAAVTVVNTYHGGELTVTKQVTAPFDTLDKDRVFSIQVELNRPVNGTYGNMTFTNGTATLSMKHGDSVSATGLPDGTRYTVTEEPNTYYNASYNGSAAATEAAGVIQESVPAAVTVTNTRKLSTGTLTVTKTSNDLYPIDGQKFKVSVQLTMNGQAVNYTDGVFINGTASFELGIGESKKLTGLPLGVTYTVTEDMSSAANYTAEYDGATGLVLGTGEMAAHIDNVRQTGDLTITKTVTGDHAEMDRVFHFTVTLGDDRIKGRFGDVDFEGGVAHVTAKHGEPKVIEGLPAGVEYSVTEDEEPGYVPQRGTISATTASTAEAAFVNVYHHGDLSVEKRVMSGGNQYGIFEFVLTFPEDNVNGTYAIQAEAGSLTELNGTPVTTAAGDLKLQVVNSQARFKLQTTAGAAKALIVGLPAGVWYNVREVGAAEYAATYFVGGMQMTRSSYAWGAIVEGQTEEVLVENTYRGGDLTISKTVVDPPAGTDPAFTFTVNITVDGQPFSRDYCGVIRPGATEAVTEKVQSPFTFELKNGQSLTLVGLPEGAQYTVTETPQAGYVRTLAAGSDMQTGEIAFHDRKEVKFVNAYRPGTLTVTKVFDVPDWYDDQLSADFTITLQGHSCSDQHGDVKFENGVGSFTLTSAAPTVTIRDLPAGTYTVTETNVPPDFAAEIEVEKGGTVRTVPGTVVKDSFSGFETQQVEVVTYTDKLTRGDLTVTKNVTGAPASDVNKMFAFRVALMNGATPIDRAFTGAVNEGGGRYAFSLGDADSIRFGDLPAGTKYTIEELADSAAGYATDITGAERTETDRSASGGIADGETDAVVYANSYMTGSLTVEKVVAGGGSALRDFSFTVTKVGDGTYNRTFANGLQFRNGVAQFTLAGGDQVTFDGIPAGDYVVRETPYAGYLAAYEPEAKEPDGGVKVTVENGRTATVTVTNTYTGGGLTITKILDGDPADPNDQFLFAVSTTSERVAGPRLAVRQDASGASHSETVNFSNNSTTVILRGGESVTIQGLPAGAVFTVRETVFPGYSADARSKSAAIPAGGAAASLTFTNAYRAGAIEITKHTTGTAAEKDRQFTFRVELSDTGCNHTHGGVKFTNGVSAKFQLHDGQSMLIDRLPLGTEYRVIELDADQYGYTTSSVNAAGAIETQGVTVPVEFTNHKDQPVEPGPVTTGTLVVTNVVGGEGADKTMDFTYTLEVTGAEAAVTGQHGDVTFQEDNAATFTLRHQQSVTVGDLPDGATVTVTQQAKDGYQTSVKTTAPAAVSALALTQEPGGAASVLKGSEKIEKGMVTHIDFTNLKFIQNGPAGPTTTEPAEPTATPTPTPEPTAAPTAPNTGDEARPVLWAALLALSALGLGAVLTLRRKKHD